MGVRVANKKLTFKRECVIVKIYKLEDACVIKVSHLDHVSLGNLPRWLPLKESIRPIPFTNYIFHQVPLLFKVHTHAPTNVFNTRTLPKPSTQNQSNSTHLHEILQTLFHVRSPIPPEPQFVGFQNYRKTLIDLLFLRFPHTRNRLQVYHIYVSEDVQ